MVKCGGGQRGEGLSSSRGRETRHGNRGGGSISVGRSFSR